MSRQPHLGRRMDSTLGGALVAIASLVFPLATAAQEAAAARTPRTLTQLELSVFAARDRSAIPASPNGGFRANLRHLLSGERIHLDLALSTQARRENGGALAAHDQRGYVNVRMALSRRTMLVVGQSVAFSPYYDPGTLGGGQDPTGGASVPAAGLGALDRSTLATSTLARVTQQLSRRSVVAAGYSFDRVWFPGSGGGAVSHRASLRFDRALERNLDLRLRYKLVRAETDIRRGTTQELEAGIAYRPRSLRGTTLFAAIAPTLSSQRDSGTVVTRISAGAFTLGGIVGVERRLAGGWEAALGYRRSVYYLRGTAEAVGADTIDGRLRRHLGRGVEISLTLSASLGKPTLTDAAVRLSSLGAVGMARVPLSNNVFVDAEYRLEQYSLGPDSGASESPLGRSRLQVGITVVPGRSTRSSRES